jgi:circadian clock protein KaiB
VDGGSQVKRRRAAEKKLAGTAERADRARYVLKLYVAGATPRSVLAITAVTGVCERFLKGRSRLEVIDIYQSPALARGGQVFAAPTLVKLLPLPARRLIGSMADEKRLLAGLGLAEGS